jgi:hypothetical protein
VDGTYYYHSSCYLDNIAPRCSQCNKPITEEYFTDGYGNAVCEQHADHADRCSACKRFLVQQPGETVTRYDDGRAVCGLCAAKAIVDIDEAKRILNDVKGQLARHGIKIDKEFSLRLVGLPELHRRSDDNGADQEGLTVYRQEKFLGGLWTVSDYDIYILYGLPYERFIGIAAHELMHIWLLENAPSSPTAPLVEGSCNYAAFLVINACASEEAAHAIRRMQEDPHPDYGQGYRAVRSLVDEIGLSGWLIYLRENKTLPQH